MDAEAKHKLEQLLDVYFNARTAFRAEPSVDLHDLIRSARSDIEAFVAALAGVTP